MQNRKQSNNHGSAGPKGLRASREVALLSGIVTFALAAAGLVIGDASKLLILAIGVLLFLYIVTVGNAKRPLVKWAKLAPILTLSGLLLAVVARLLTDGAFAQLGVFFEVLAPLFVFSGPAAIQISANRS